MLKAGVYPKIVQEWLGHGSIAVTLDTYSHVVEEAIKAFIDFYNQRHYHEGLGDVTPCAVYTGEHLGIIQRRREVKNRTLQARRDYNRAIREQDRGL